jgi:hypothetical protein
MERAWKAEYTCACVMSWSCRCGACKGPARERSGAAIPGRALAQRRARRCPHEARASRRALHWQAPALSRSSKQPGHAPAARAGREARGRCARTMKHVDELVMAL